MPELPEVEILVRQLAPRLRGAVIRRLEVRDAKLGLPVSLVGRKILRVRRRGKFIIFNLDDGRHLLAHLRMTGWFEFRKPARYRAAIATDRATIYFEDSRRFGVLMAVTSKELDDMLRWLGPEPLAKGFDLSRLSQTSRVVKVALLDQSLVAGLGNIYASESLWRARINPRRKANRLRAGEVQRLQHSIIAALRKAVAYGPRIFAVQQFNVYERAGKLCRRCGTKIRRIVQGQRSTYFCPDCQR